MKLLEPEPPRVDDLPKRIIIFNDDVKEASHQVGRGPDPVAAALDDAVQCLSVPSWIVKLLQTAFNECCKLIMLALQRVPFPHLELGPPVDGEQQLRSGVDLLLHVKAIDIRPDQPLLSSLRAPRVEEELLRVLAHAPEKVLTYFQRLPGHVYVCLPPVEATVVSRT